MVDIKYANAYSEVLEILKYISVEEYNKIPKNKIKLFETNANKNYIFKYDTSKTLDEQNVSKITKGIIAILFRDYWANEIQRQKIITKQKLDRIKIEKEKQAKYNTNIFHNGKHFKQNIGENTIINNVAMVEYKESMFKRIIKRVKKIFGK